MPVLLLLGWIVLFGGAVVAAAIAGWQKSRRVSVVAIRAAIVAIGCTALYAAALLATSLASQQRALAINESKAFCGFYLDCHMHVAVARVDTIEMIGTATTPVRPNGVFIAVTLRLSSDAARASINLLTPTLVVRDADGREYGRAPDAERALAVAGAPHDSLTKTVEAGQSFLTTVVFDVARDARHPTLDVNEGYAIDRALESLLIGDEDSFLHKPTVFRLGF